MLHYCFGGLYLSFLIFVVSFDKLSISEKIDIVNKKFENN